jgi:hypothetical protein
MINFEFVENFVTEEQAEEKHVVLIEILADSLNYGYSGHAWRVLDAVNGCHIKNLAQLAKLYRSFTGEYFVFEFSVVRTLSRCYILHPTTAQVCMRAGACLRVCLFF